MKRAESRCIYIRARALVLVEVGGGNRALKLALQILARHADRDRLPVHRYKATPRTYHYAAHFFALKKIFPSNLGSSGTTLSSARKRPFSFSSKRRASNGFHFPFRCRMSTTREMNLIPSRAMRSLYSRWGSFTMRQTGLVRGSTIGCLTGLESFS